MTHRPTDSVFPTTPQGYVVDTIETRISKSFSYRSGAFKKNATCDLEEKLSF